MGYNLEKIHAMSDGDNEFIEAVVVAFIEEIPADLTVFEKEIVAKHYKGIYQISHKIKPNLELLGMDAAFELNFKILNWAKAETNMDDIAENFPKLKAMIDENILELKKEFNLP
ncbi:HPt (histidine-containing phosphotransfer) domain-containing protein [Kordia periserrulae]|uniref:HPt (Histidine-containing phosphotransfer) domain-containing protein n=1 Tax=Kordia periserrulae TaxID=701523 RepID=A0A2T6BSE6_9FLAO|nr:Hpt domain-containing protein [Kordia periserrulae]PTX59008.1 HPt (histidine-containing phosphotransfer) domain-containing protein [Kordia periserrulae]